jgi:catalase
LHKRIVTLRFLRKSTHMPDDSNASTEKLPAPLSMGKMLVRLGIIGIAILSVVGAFAYLGGWFMSNRLTPWRLIDTFEEVNGVHPGFRRNHAKGVCVSGFFESNGRGVRLSKAVVFQPGRVAVLGRFALAGGQPYAADAPHIVRSMAILFELPDGEQWRTGMNNIPVFPVKTPEGFLEQLVASRPDPGTGKPDPAKMKEFLARHPETVRALEMIDSQPAPSGFENSTYNSLSAFRFVNAAGTSTAVRWSMAPRQPFEAVSSAPAQVGDNNYLFDALIAGIHRQPLLWHLILTLGLPADQADDATIAWPANREKLDVGTLTIDHIASEEDGGCRDINFDPLVLPSGILPSDDPLLSARSAAYSQSFTRRAGETKGPSAVTASETGK